ncbi:hypothetical protein FC093_21540 [Ilyomonas limi]|uniref:histidine kinase n=1 Tax=Ilyomonas limi TaxID=2575867 RepID=A0A4U3KRI3_9BACT|nr:ATP-binding protein [Ilyomonas limi]TKK64841.1 hypothetical protein FC093_21540 [Ilyomonas limi]
MHPEETRIYIAVLTAGCILGILIIFLFVTIIRYHRRKVALYLEKILADTQLMEQDRARIASDLHDDLGSSLSAIRLQLDLLPEDSRYIQTVTAARRTIDDAIGKVKQISKNMMPITLKEQGLKEAVVEYISMLPGNNKGKVQLEWNIHEQGIPQNHKIHIYRIIQEVLTNALKHAQAGVIAIQMHHRNNMLELSITDNGVGFDKRVLKRSRKGLGLRNITTRADILKAAVYLNTAPGKGVSYQFLIPLPPLLQ